MLAGSCQWEKKPNGTTNPKKNKEDTITDDGILAVTVANQLFYKLGEMVFKKIVVVFCIVYSL